MPALLASAPGKAILFGEHAVVYGRPAIAVPVDQVKAKAAIFADPRGAPGTLRIEAPDIGVSSLLADMPVEDPLACAVRAVLNELKVARPPAGILRITSSIPVAAGLGSGAAVSVAIIRALSSFLGQPLAEEQVSSLAFEVEKLHHGTPSGIDNTVITYNRPVYFVRGQPIQTLRVPQAFTLLIGDTGIPSPTVTVVASVRAARNERPGDYERLFDAITALTQKARQAIESGQVDKMGPLMYENHTHLQSMGVSSPELDRLVQAARDAGARGAKLSGGGRGGNMIALVDKASAKTVESTLLTSGARQVIVTQVGETV
jgi:mevalonate kinase